MAMSGGWFVYGVEARKGNQRARSHYMHTKNGSISGCGIYLYSSTPGHFVETNHVSFYPERCKTCVKAEKKQHE